MLKKTINYVDYDGVEHKEDFYFNLSKGELIKMRMSEKGGLENVIGSMINESDEVGIYKAFESIVDASYGLKSPDGKYFRKSPEILADFKSTEAYSELIMELTTDEGSIAAFINGILPSDLRAQVAEELKKRESSK